MQGCTRAYVAPLQIVTGRKKRLTVVCTSSSFKRRFHKVLCSATSGCYWSDVLVFTNLKKHSRWRPDKWGELGVSEIRQFKSKMVHSFFQWKMKFQTFPKWKYVHQKLRPRAKILVWLSKLPWIWLKKKFNSQPKKNS